MEELDPEIEALLNSVEPLEELPSDDENRGFKKKVFLDYSEDELISSKKKSIHEVDLSQKEFEPITEFTNETPLTVFDDTKYYKTALTDGLKNTKKSINDNYKAMTAATEKCMDDLKKDIDSKSNIEIIF